MTRRCWDSSQICVTHSPVVTRKPYCPPRVRGQPAEDGGGRRAVEAVGGPDGRLELLAPHMFAEGTP